ncbi:MAG: hypothetical protein ABSF53_13060 [Terracidiphilus sp.]|jgi:hypothetical protein
MLILQSAPPAFASVLNDLPRVITAIGGLGTAAFGLVDSTKPFWGGVNRIGFKQIATAVKSLTPGTPAAGLSQAKIVATLKANWYNGKDLSSQKAIAKSLIKQGLTAANAPTLAALTGVDATVLTNVATKIAAGTPLAPGESDVYGRLDFVLTALLDEVYQNSDQKYTNWTRIWASLFAVVLAFFAGWQLSGQGFGDFWWTRAMAEAVLVGVLATPLAPIAKDLSSALATAVNTMQAIKK